LRSVAVGLALAVAAAAAYLAARETSIFAVAELRVVGAPPPVAAEVRRALEPVMGKSLVSLATPSLDRRLAPLPDVVSARYDRAYPDTLVVYVTAEQPAVVLRRASEAWLVSARGRVLRALPPRSGLALPRVWVPRSVEVSPGAIVPDQTVRRALRTLVPIMRDPLPVAPRTVRARGELTLALRNGTEVRLGDASRLALKLEVARRVVPLAGGARYVDLSVPERPVAGPYPQVEGLG
jgi:cell division protein FtsQ